MEFSISREALMKPLQRVVGVIDKKQASLQSNVLFVLKNQLLALIGTDKEIEMIARVPLTEAQVQHVSGATTIPGKKLWDICRALPEEALLSFKREENKVFVRSGRSRYALACLPSENFPRIEESSGDVECSVSQLALRQLMDSTSFAMAQQDVRYYLNGVCLIFMPDQLRMVATDGHRLATMALPLRSHLTQPLSVIVPRKAVLEMQRLFAEGEEEIGVVIGKNHLKAVSTHYSFITKLVSGKFPDYRRVLPSQSLAYQMEVSREQLRQVLLRVSALFSDKYRGVGLQFSPQLLRVIAVTADKDEVEDEIEVHYDGPSLEIGLNANYLIEYLNMIKTEKVRATFTDPNQVVLFEAVNEDGTLIPYQHAYVVMPMRL